MDLNIQWELPTTRDNGRPQDPAKLAFARIELSADLGANYGLLGEFPPGVLETVIPDIDPGTWFVRGWVVDDKGKVSEPIVDSIEVEDTSRPGTLTLLLSLT